MTETDRSRACRTGAEPANRLVRTAWLVLFLLGLSAPVVSSARAEPNDQEKTIDDILTRLEKRSEGLKDIRCNVRFVEKDKINLTTRIKYGDILFLITEPNPQFKIHFDKTEVDGVLGQQEWYLFDGRWFYQALERIKQVTKQEIARVGEKREMFDLEKAPFPLPFGQKKESILRNFDVTLVPPVDGDPPNSDHLVCIPKPTSTLRKKYDKLELFLLRDVHLPGRIVVTKNQGYEINTADFVGLSLKSINTGVTRKDFAVPKQWRNYEEVVERLSDPPHSTP